MSGLRYVDLMPVGELEALARYNAECARGIVHTKAWDRKMAGIQAYYEDLARRDLAERGELVEQAEAGR